MKTVRFTKVVEVAGNPEPYTLWQDPHEDPEFQKAIHDHRVMTVIRDPASSKADVATIGYLKQAGALYLLFPKTLKEFQDKRIIGLKYDLLTDSKPRGTAVELGKPRKRLSRKTPPPRLKIAEPKAEAERPSEPDPPQPKRLPKFQVRAKVVASVETELEIEARNKNDARKAAAKQLEHEPFDFTPAKRQVKVINISKAKE